MTESSSSERRVEPAPATTTRSNALDDVRGSSIGRNMVHLLFSQVATGLFATVLSIVQPRFLGDTAQGQLGLAAAIWAIAEVLTALGTSYYLTLAIARNRTQGMSLLGPILVLRFVVFGVLAAAIGAVLVVSDVNVRFAEIMAIQGAMMLLGSLSETITAAFTGLEKLSVPASASVAARIFGTTTAIAVLVAGGDARSVVAVGATANLLLLIVLTRAIRRLTVIRPKRLRVDSTTIVKGSAGFLVSALVITVYRQIDTIVISLFVEREVLGWYATADALAGSLLFPITIAMTSILPVLGRLFVDDVEAMRSLVRRSFTALTLVAVPTGLGITIIGQQLAPLLYGEEFRPTGPVLVVLGPVIVLTFFTILFGSIALATGRQWFWNALLAVAIALTIPLDVVLVPWTEREFANGAIGGSLAYVVTEGLMFVVGLWKIAPYLANRTMALRFVRVLLAGGSMFAASWPLRDRFIAVPVVVAAIVYALAVFALRVITDDEREIAGRALERIGLRTNGLRRNGEP